MRVGIDLRPLQTGSGRRDIERPYLLNVGGFDPLRNLSVALEASGLRRRQGDRLRLVVAGAAAGTGEMRGRA